MGPPASTSLISRAIVHTEAVEIVESASRTRSSWVGCTVKIVDSHVVPDGARCISILLDVLVKGQVVVGVNTGFPA